MENNMMIIIWRDIFVTFVFWISARMVFGREKFTIKCVGKPSNSHLWRLNRNPPSYLFGTIHYPWDILWNDPNHIHKNVKYAFKKSQSIYTELDFHNLTTVSALQRCRFLPGTLTLKKVLPRRLLFRLRRHLSYVKRSIGSWLQNRYNTNYERAVAADHLYRSITQNWRRKRPIWMVVLIMLELAPASVRRRQQNEILDLFLTNHGKRKGKNVGGLETAEDQCGPFNNINNRQAIFLLNYTLHLQELIRSGRIEPEHESEQDKILKLYLCGNLEKGIVAASNRLLVNSNAKDHIAESQVKKIIEIEEYLMHELVYKRNMKMTTRIDDLLKTNKSTTFFFAIGTGHLSGKSSVVELLQKKGHQIDHIKPRDFLAGQKRWERKRERRKQIKKRNKKREEEHSRRHNLFFTEVDKFVETRITTKPESFRTRKQLPTIQPIDGGHLDTVLKVEKQHIYVYYYTNATPRTVLNGHILIICWFLIQIIRQFVT